MKNSETYPTLIFETQHEWEMWLEQHQSEAKGVWLKLAKKASGLPSMTYAEAVDVALCYGWIDSQAASCDTQYWLQKFTPRGPRSRWSQINRDKVGVLLAAGRMRAEGIRQVELAQARRTMGSSVCRGRERQAFQRICLFTRMSVALCQSHCTDL